jgi:hypothetical protein
MYYRSLQGISNTISQIVTMTLSRLTFPGFPYEESIHTSKLTIGNENYKFYFPLEIDDFVVCVWTRGPVLDKFCVSIYLHGNLVSQKEPRLRGFDWAEKLDLSWSEEIFTRRDVQQMVSDLKDLEEGSIEEEVCNRQQRSSL